MISILQNHWQIFLSILLALKFLRQNIDIVTVPYAQSYVGTRHGHVTQHCQGDQQHSQVYQLLLLWIEQILLISVKLW